MLAVLLTERGLGGDGVDLERRLTRFRARALAARRRRARQLAERLAQGSASPWREVARAGELGAGLPLGAGALLLHAWPDRVAKARGERGRFVLANGSGAHARRRRSAGRRGLPRRRRPAGQGAERPHRRGRGGRARPTSARRLADRHRDARARRAFDRERARRARARDACGSAPSCCRERMLPPPPARRPTARSSTRVAQHGLSLLPWSEDARDAARSGSPGCTRPRRALARHVRRGAARHASTTGCCPSCPARRRFARIDPGVAAGRR